MYTYQQQLQKWDQMLLDHSPGSDFLDLQLQLKNSLDYTITKYTFIVSLFQINKFHWFSWRCIFDIEGFQSRDKNLAAVTTPPYWCTNKS